jgi:hypothetical protein
MRKLVMEYLPFEERMTVLMGELLTDQPYIYHLTELIREVRGSPSIPISQAKALIQISSDFLRIK